MSLQVLHLRLLLYTPPLKHPDPDLMVPFVVVFLISTLQTDHVAQWVTTSVTDGVD